MTIFGESAGAMSVLHHVASPLSKGLFARAISQSGIIAASTASFGTSVSNDYAAKLGCKGLTGEKMLGCLRGKSVEALIAEANEQANPFTQVMTHPPTDLSPALFPHFFLPLSSLSSLFPPLPSRTNPLQSNPVSVHGSLGGALLSME
jgi:carboxylesterase type B